MRTFGDGLETSSRIDLQNSHELEFSLAAIFIFSLVNAAKSEKLKAGF